MTDYTYDSELVADPFTFQRAANAAITVYDVTDTSETTPLALKDLQGLPLPNPLTSSAEAFVPAFMAPSAQVKMVGGGLRVVRSSFQGVRDEAIAAKAAAAESKLAAQTAASSAAAAVSTELAGAVGNATAAASSASTSAAAAAAAAALVGAPSDAAIATAINGVGTATRAALNATYATPEVGVSRVLAKLHGGQPVKITAVGDSWLEGLTVNTPSNAFMPRLEALLEARFGSAVTTTNRAVSGYSAYRVLDAGSNSPTKFSQALTDAADLYVICFGANDAASAVVSAYTPGSGYPVPAFKASIEHMIRRIRIDVPGADILLSNQGPMTGSSHSSDGNLETYRIAIREVAAAYGLGFIDFQAELINLGANGTTPAKDDLYIWPVGHAWANHPKDEGHRIWAEAALQFFPADRLPAPHAPTVPAQPFFGAERYTGSPWVVAPIGRANGSAGIKYIGSWAAATTVPQVSSTAGDQIEFMFIGTEAIIRLDAGVGSVSITVDGEPLNMNLNLSAFGTGERRFPITGRDPGIHRVVVTILTGTVTFRGASYLPAIGQQIKYDSPLITYGGSWIDIGTAGEPYWEGFAYQGDNGDYVEVSFVGTGLSVQCSRFDFTLNYTITVDGGTPYSEGWNAGGGGHIPGAKTIVKGLPYGRHTVRVAIGASTTLRVSAFFAFDETRTLRPNTLAGLSATAEAVRHPIALPTVPAVQITPSDSTSTVPPYPSSNTVSTFTVGGTASAKHSWRLDSGRLAY